MNRFTYLMFLMTLIYQIVAYSQTNYFGLKLGIQSAGVSDNQFAEGRILGFSIYGFVDLNISHNFNSTIELGLTQRGYKNKMIETSEEGEFIQDVIATSKVTYISISPFVDYNIFLPSNIIYLGIAPRFDILVNKEPGKFSFTTITITDELINYLDKTIWGISFVAGIKDIKLSGINFRIEGKYEMDITDSLSKYPANYKNNVLMLLIGVNI